MKRIPDNKPPSDNSREVDLDNDESLDGFQEMALRRQLQEAYAAPPLREAFTESLAHRLDKAFEQSHSSDKVERAKATETPPSSSASSDPNQHQRKLRWQLYLVAGLAASVLLAFITLASRDSYSWTAMLDAMQEQQWVEANAESAQSASDGNARFWFSSRRRVSAQQNIRGTLFRDFTRRSMSNYSPERKVVTINTLSNSTGWDIQSQLLSAIIPERNSAESENSDPVQIGKLRVVSETWKQVEAEEGKRQIALHVKLQQQDPPHETLRLNFRCDPETHLPVSCEVVSRPILQPTASGTYAGFRQPQRHQVNFSYPSSGPQTIYALGVPEDASVRNAADH